MVASKIFLIIQSTCSRVYFKVWDDVKVDRLKLSVPEISDWIGYSD